MRSKIKMIRGDRKKMEAKIKSKCEEVQKK